MNARKRVVEAEEFILRDRDGTIRAKLTVEESPTGPTVALMLGGRDGVPRLQVTTTADGEPEIALLDEDRRPALVLSVLCSFPSPHRGPAIVLISKGDAAGATLFARDDGVVSLSLARGDTVLFNAPESQG